MKQYDKRYTKQKYAWPLLWQLIKPEKTDGTKEVKNQAKERGSNDILILNKQQFKPFLCSQTEYFPSPTIHMKQTDGS